MVDRRRIPPAGYKRVQPFCQNGHMLPLPETDGLRKPNTDLYVATCPLCGEQCAVVFWERIQLFPGLGF